MRLVRIMDHRNKHLPFNKIFWLINPINIEVIWTRHCLLLTDKLQFSMFLVLYHILGVNACWWLLHISAWLHGHSLGDYWYWFSCPACPCVCRTYYYIKHMWIIKGVTISTPKRERWNTRDKLKTFHLHWNSLWRTEWSELKTPVFL